MLRAGKLFDCPHVLKCCFNAYVLSSLEYCASVWLSSSESQLGLLDSTVCSEERLCEGELCYFGPKRKDLLYENYHTVNHHMSKYLNNFVSARNTKASAALGELDMINQFSRSFLPAALCMWNLLPSSVFSGDSLSYMKRAKTCAYWGHSLIFPIYFNLFLLFYSLLGIMVLGSVLVYKGMLGKKQR